MTAISTAALSATALSGSSSLSSSMRRKCGVVYIEGLNSFGGLKAHNIIVSLGMHLAVICNARELSQEEEREQKGLVLVGVAVGFVLLRVEASLEQAE